MASFKGIYRLIALSLAVPILSAAPACAQDADDAQEAMFGQVDHVRVAIEAERSEDFHAVAEPLKWTVEEVQAPDDDARPGIDAGVAHSPRAWFVLRREKCCELIDFHQLRYAWESLDGDPYFRIEFMDAGGEALGMQD